LKTESSASGLGAGVGSALALGLGVGAGVLGGGVVPRADKTPDEGEAVLPVQAAMIGASAAAAPSAPIRSRSTRREIRCSAR
jgi:hypothetical protein